MIWLTLVVKGMQQQRSGSLEACIEVLEIRALLAILAVLVSIYLACNVSPQKKARFFRVSSFAFFGFQNIKAKAIGIVLGSNARHLLIFVSQPESHPM